MIPASSEPRSFLQRWWPALAMGAAVLVAHLATNGRYGFFRDELYFIACGRHPAWGYVDQPPLTPLLAAASAWLSGDALNLFRLPAALAHAALVIATAAFARWLGGRTFAALVAGTCAAVAPLFLAEGHQLTMNSFEPLSWLAMAWLVAAQLRSAEPRRWVAVGAVLGVALLNKHSAAFYAASLFAGLLLAPERRALASKWVLAGAGFAALVVLPHVAWQVANGWPMLELLRNGQLYKNAPVALPEFFGQVVLALQPVSLPVWAAGLFFVFAQRERRLRFLGWGFVVLLALFIALKAKFYYFAPAFPPFLAAGAVQWERWLDRWPRIRYAVPAVLLAGGVATAPLVIPALSPERVLAYQRALGIQAPRLERHVYREMPQHFADEFGWRELADNVAAVYRALPENERASAVVFAPNYGEAAALEFFGPKLGLPRAISGHNNYWLWGPGAPSVIIVVGGDSVEDHEDACGSVELARRIPPNPYVMAYEDELNLFVCRDLKVSLAEFWPRVRHYE